MYIRFENNDEYGRMKIAVEGREYTLEPESEIEISCFGNNIAFTAEYIPPDFSDDIKAAEGEVQRLRDKLILRATKKLAKKINEIALYARLIYDITDTDTDVAVTLTAGAYSSCDGRFADFFDMLPIAYCFAQAEADSGRVSVSEVKIPERRKYLRMQRRLMLFMDWGLILPDLLLFIPKYAAVRYFCSDRYVSGMIKGLYGLTPSERLIRLTEKEEQLDRREKGSGCLSEIVKALISFAIIIGIGCWALSSDTEADVLMSEDFSRVVCFEEVFVRIEGGLPADAKETLLEDYSVYYPKADGEYDTDSYECHIYEDSAGERYMWVKTDCNNPDNIDKEYEDYENPWVYISDSVIVEE